MRNSSDGLKSKHRANDHSGSNLIEGIMRTVSSQSSDSSNLKPEDAVIGEGVANSPYDAGDLFDPEEDLNLSENDDEDQSITKEEAVESLKKSYQKDIVEKNEKRSLDLLNEIRVEAYKGYALISLINMLMELKSVKGNVSNEFFHKLRLNLGKHCWDKAEKRKDLYESRMEEIPNDETIRGYIIPYLKEKLKNNLLVEIWNSCLEIDSLVSDFKVNKHVESKVKRLDELNLALLAFKEKNIIDENKIAQIIAPINAIPSDQLKVITSLYEKIISICRRTAKGTIINDEFHISLDGISNAKDFVDSLNAAYIYATRDNNHIKGVEHSLSNDNKSLVVKITNMNVDGLWPNGEVIFSLAELLNCKNNIIQKLNDSKLPTAQAEFFKVFYSNMIQLHKEYMLETPITKVLDIFVIGLIQHREFCDNLNQACIAAKAGSDNFASVSFKPVKDNDNRTLIRITFNDTKLASLWPKGELLTAYIEQQKLTSQISIP